MNAEQDILSKLDEIKTLITDNARLNRHVEILEEFLGVKNQFVIALEPDGTIIYHNLPHHEPISTLEDLSLLLGAAHLRLISERLARGIKKKYEFTQGGLLFRLIESGKGFYLILMDSLEDEPDMRETTLAENLSAAGEEAEEIRRLTLELEEIKKIHLEDNPGIYTRQIREVHLPRLAELRDRYSDPVLSKCLEIIEGNLMEILEPVPSAFSRPMIASLTPSELRIAEFIRKGKSTKEIADALSIAAKTVENHRNNLRTKLGIANKRVNLRTYLMNIL